ncbi:MAG: hypothetical protein K9L30_14585 [Desulfobacterales bacterium]|nr:hypothetical protein [Desulfobacterales bacterium]
MEKKADKPINLSQIKNNLEDSYTYIIFEKILRPGEIANTKEIINLFTRFKKNIVNHEDYCDVTGRHLFIVVKLAPIELEYITQELISIIDPEDFSFTIYNSWPKE